MAAGRQDKRTLGVTPEGAALLESIMQTDWFKEEMDAYLVAISLAFANDLIAGTEEMVGVTTKWNVGTLDQDGKLRRMVLALSSEQVERPYAVTERRAAAGLGYLKARLVDEHAELSAVLMPEEG